jgi:uncharacterized protein DUF6484
MSQSVGEIRAAAGGLPPVSQALCLGQIVEITRQGKVLVDFPGNPWGPVEARCIAAPASEVPPPPRTPVLLWFEGGDRALPIVVGWVRDRLLPAAAQPEAPNATAAPAAPSRDVTVDGRQVVIEGEREIVLRCGESSITLRRDGKILIKGTSLVSHASGSNKIKGAHVAIN